jgi:hypothetical protein
MFKRRKKYFKKRDLNNIDLEKPNTKAKKILLLVEITLVLLVISGTAYGSVKFFNFSPIEYFQDNVYKVSPKSPIPPPQTKVKDKGDEIIEALPEDLFTFKSVEGKTKDELRIVSKQGTLAIFSLGKNVDLQLSTLQSLLTKAKINKKKVKRVDLRFDKVVIVYGK